MRGEWAGERECEKERKREGQRKGEGVRRGEIRRYFLLRSSIRAVRKIFLNPRWPGWTANWSRSLSR